MPQLIPYPTDPFPAMRVFISKMQGDPSVQLAQAIHAGYELAGCGLGVFVPDATNTGFSAISDEEAVKAMQDCCAQAEVAGSEGFRAIKLPWEIILPIVVSKLDEWVKQWLKGGK